MEPDHIIIRGAQQHNLKNIDVSIPRYKLVVLTGVSGSGKSSLAFDTIYAEGQRRYVESLSSYARQFLGQMEKPRVDYIGGLSPAISIEQKVVSKNPRSTVGTVTEVMDYLRVLYARIGAAHCPQCGRVVQAQSAQQIADQLAQQPPGTRMQLLAPLVRERKGTQTDVIEQALKDGYTRARIDGSVVDLSAKLALQKTKKHTVELVVDRLVAPAKGDDVWGAFAARLVDSVETALRASKGLIVVDLLNGEEIMLSEQNACPHCGISFPDLSPQTFSFNSPLGMCPDCNGLGAQMAVDPQLIITDPTVSVLDGALKWYGDLRRKKRNWQINHLKTLAAHYKADIEKPWRDLPKKFRDVVLYGSGEEKIHFEWKNEGKDSTWAGESNRPEKGIIFHINRLFRQTQSEWTKRWYLSFMSQQPCPTCGGARLRPEARTVTVGGKTITEVGAMAIDEAYAWVVGLYGGPEPEYGSQSGDNHAPSIYQRPSSNGHRSRVEPLTGEKLQIAGEVLKEIRDRLRFMLNVGLHYLTLDRPAPSLSGGEGQRIRLASQIGCGLVGVLYILDEPSIGLHSRDNRALLNTLLQLRDMGNTVLVVEHDAETMLHADWLVDLGPGAGVLGGRVIAAGTPAEVAANPDSLTGKYLSGKLQVTAPNNSQRRPTNGKWLTLKGARTHNLKNLSVRIPLGVMTCITGVSGSGKSSLITETLHPALAKALNGAQSQPGPYEALGGLEHLDKVIDITQEPIGRTPRSNPATYVGLFDEIRRVFAATPEAKARGYGIGRFSFNVKGGRCEACQGHGQKRIEMHFLADVWVTCQECKGSRFNRDTLAITYKGRNIAEVLDMDVQEALQFFSAFPVIARQLQTLHDVGLDYVKLGQSATTLSGGEAQRVKLAKELSRADTGRTIYILDEPTTGLHFADIQHLLDVLHRLVDQGNTVIVIEHNLDVVKTADWIIDLGPEGGAQGGYIIAVGTPEEIIQEPNSYTGRFLKQMLTAHYPITIP
ncbi:MAG: excinuclease ABC subunit UvrA [Chloroflexi bacterium]|nr:excinuclease ABC subunit UvrA [Chloroflexota bacterium]MCL5275485.1 excinuclease ABC subunit UvrA [Chloroflexota bacterium]